MSCFYCQLLRYKIVSKPFQSTFCFSNIPIGPGRVHLVTLHSIGFTSFPKLSMKIMETTATHKNDICHFTTLYSSNLLVSVIDCIHSTTTSSFPVTIHFFTLEGTKLLLFSPEVKVQTKPGGQNCFFAYSSRGKLSSV